MSRLKDCPFCNKAVVDDVHYNELNERWIFSHYCKTIPNKLSVTIDIYGKSEQEVVDLWNGEHENQKSKSL